MAEQQINTSSPKSSILSVDYKVAMEEQKAKLVVEMEKEDSLLRKTMNANGVFRPSDMKFNDAFYRFPRNDPFNYVDGAREYLFFTKPDLPLVKSVNGQTAEGFLTEPAYNIAYFRDLAESPGYRKAVFSNLSYSGVKRSDGCPFIRILTNRKTSNMDVPDITAEELETAVNMYGSKILYPKSSQSNDEDLDFTIEFEDTRFCEVFHLFKVWDYYRNLRWYGVISPASFLKEFGSNKKQRQWVDKSLTENLKEGVNSIADAIKRDFMDPDQSYDGVERDYVGYIFHKVLHDHIRVFKFLVDNDGETILYAASAIGCFPKTIQRSAFSEIPDKGPLKISVGFKLSGWFEDDITSVCKDFNTIVKSWVPIETCKDSVIPIYDHDIDMVSQELVDVPFILSVQGGSGRASEFNRYMLLWAKAKQTGSNESYAYSESEYTSSETPADNAAKGTETSSEPMTNIKAPNGKFYTQNDYDYLKNEGYDEEQIIAILSEDPKYKASEAPSSEESNTETSNIPSDNQSTTTPTNATPATSTLSDRAQAVKPPGSAPKEITSISGQKLKLPAGSQYIRAGNNEYILDTTTGKTYPINSYIVK